MTKRARTESRRWRGVARQVDTLDVAVFDAVAHTSSPLLDANLLQLFVVLYDTHGVTRAAEQLNMAQPTISIWLSRLRKQLNDPLFVRTPAGMQPTPVAEALIGTAREALSSLRRISHWDVQFDPATAERRFCICMSDVANITLLPQIQAHTRIAAPHITLKALRIDKQTAQFLENGEADLAIGLVIVAYSRLRFTLTIAAWFCS